MKKSFITSGQYSADAPANVCIWQTRVSHNEVSMSNAYQVS